MTKRILTATVLTIAAIMQVDAVVPDDNVVIPEGKESYRFVQVKGGFEVVHTVAYEYLATRRSEKIQPHIFHDNNIRLDKASGGSRNTVMLIHLRCFTMTVRYVSLNSF